MAAVPPCPRKWIRGCRFEPRYDLGSPRIANLSAGRMTESSFVAVIEASKPKTYVRDVCTTCGRTIEREA